jgi:hypothetical protein
VRRGSGALALALLAATSAPAARAQDNPALQEAVRLAGEGRGDAARRLVAAELAKARVGDSAYVEALYWRARLAVTGDSAERDLRRVAIEFPGSRWADDALLQLAQLAMAAGNPPSALALAERLRGDYPGSELRPQAALWAGRAAFDLGDARGACALLDSARTEGGADVEFVNRVAFYHARCAALPAVPATGQPAAPGPDSARPQPRPSVPQAATPRVGAPSAAHPGEFAIQVAAVRTEAEASRVLKRIADAGLSGHVAAGSDGLRRVRVGAYATEREAQDALPAVRRALGGRPFVVRER